MPSAVHRAPRLVSALRVVGTRPHLIFATLALIGGTIWASTVPPLWGSDETVHFMRAYHVSTGHLATEDFEGGASGGYLPPEIVQLIKVVGDDLHNEKGGLGRVDDRSVYRAPLDRQLTEGVRTDITPAAAYSPVAYLGSAAGIAIVKPLDSSLGGALWGARMGNLLLYVGIISAAIRLLDTSRLRWVAFVVGLAPLSLFQASTVNVDAISIATAALMAAILARVWSQGYVLTVPHAAALMAAAAVLAQTKPNFVFVSMLAVFLPARCFGSTWLRRSMRYGSPLIVLVPFLAWNLSISGDVSAGSDTMLGPDNGIDLGGQMSFVADDPFGFLRSVIVTGLDYDWYSTAFSRVGFNQVSFPVVNTIAVSVLLLLATFASGASPHVTRGSKWPTFSAWLAGGVAAFTALSIVGTMYLTWTRVGSPMIEGVQGRYFVPLIPFFAYAASFLPIEVRMPRRAEATMFVLGTMACFALCLAWYRRATFV